MGKRPVVLFTASTCSHIFNFHRPYLEEFHRLGWEVHVACGGPMYPIPEADRVILLPFAKKMSAPENYIAARILRREINKNSYSLITTHTSLAAFFTRLSIMGMENHPPLINIVHGYLFDDETPLLKRKLLVAAEKLTAKQTNLLLTMNEWDYTFAHKQKLSKNVGLIPGIGVDFANLDTCINVTPEKLRKEQGLCADDFLLIYAAEFSDRKNQSMIIRALPYLPQRVKLLLPGGGELWEDCLKLVQLLGLEKRVIMPGHVSNMPSLYLAADVAVSSSCSEGLPFNVMEAMHFALPVIASHVKGHTDLITDGKTGILYPLNDGTAFVKAINSLLNDQGLSRELGNEGKRSIDRFSLIEVMPKVMEQYLSVFTRY